MNENIKFTKIQILLGKHIKANLLVRFIYLVFSFFSFIHVCLPPGWSHFNERWTTEFRATGHLFQEQKP